MYVREYGHFEIPSVLPQHCLFAGNMAKACAQQRQPVFDEEAGS